MHVILGHSACVCVQCLTSRLHLPLSIKKPPDLLCSAWSWNKHGLHIWSCWVSYLKYSKPPCSGLSRTVPALTNSGLEFRAQELCLSWHVKDQNLSNFNRFCYALITAKGGTKGLYLFFAHILQSEGLFTKCLAQKHAYELKSEKKASLKSHSEKISLFILLMPIERKKNFRVYNMFMHKNYAPTHQ